MPEVGEYTRPEGGMFIWMTLPKHMNGAELLVQSLAEQRVAFVPGQAFFADGSGANTIRLNFTNASAKQIETGIARLGQLIQQAVSNT